jgi:FtsP/CotA-like multicopper oxidase with cupredoxin domain
MTIRERRLGRRDLLRLGAGMAAAGIAGPALAKLEAPRSPRFTPFTRELWFPPDLAPVDPGGSFFEVHMKEAWREILPGYETRIWGYDGLFPGPTIRAEANQPITVRFHNDLPDAETSIHYHSGHTEAASDGHPNLLIEPGHHRDYHYSNKDAGDDENEQPTTGWYHDHALDVTAYNVMQGLAGFYLSTCDLERTLVDDHRIPDRDGDLALDVPLCIQDRRFTRDGQLFYDPLDHDGFLGDVYVVNGRAQPYFKVKRRKYRLRLLNGCNARFLELRLSHGAFLRFGVDGWLLPKAVLQSRILLASANRADVIVDFGDAPDVVYLENICVQEDGRGPEGDLANHKVRIPGAPVLKFVVEGPKGRNDTTLSPEDLEPVRRNTPIQPGEIVATRVFEFERGNGAWQINGRFFDPKRDDATPKLGTAERWILRNKSGGWWHPIHLHLESHQVHRFNGRRVASPYKQDTVILGPNDEAEVFIHFRDYTGQFVFHCHNVEHEDVRMMGQFNVKEG